VADPRTARPKHGRWPDRLAICSRHDEPVVLMPIIECRNPAGLDDLAKDRLAEQITADVQAVIRSPQDLISVTFDDLPAGSTYRAGTRTADTVIICHIREGRSDEAILRLMGTISATWSKHTHTAEEHIELAVAQYPAKHTMRRGQRLPEPPIV